MPVEQREIHLAMTLAGGSTQLQNYLFPVARWLLSLLWLNKARSHLSVLTQLEL